jgi:hypothetical protein
MKKRFILRNDNNLTRVKQSVWSELKRLDFKQPKEITIGDYTENKTDEQRNSFHLLCKLFADETGYTLHEIKELVKFQEFGTNLILIGGVEHGVSISSESLKRTDYARLIEATYRLAAQGGIVLPVLNRLIMD